MFESMGEQASPVMVTQSEYMRRMKEMAALQPGMSFYGELPDSYNLIINTDHPLCKKVLSDTESSCNDRLTPVFEQIDENNKEITRLNEARKDKKDEEIPVADKEALKAAESKATDLRKEEEKILSEYAGQTPLVKQLVDLALLSNNLLKGEALSRFIKRSFELL